MADSVVDITYGVFNDPAYFEPRFARGEIHPLLREQILEKPMFESALPGPAKRFMNWANTQRLEEGGPDRVARDGYVILREQRVIKEPWRTIEGAELEAIDDGRRPNG